MKRINIIDAGIKPDGCVSERLTQLIADAATTSSCTSRAAATTYRSQWQLSIGGV